MIAMKRKLLLFTIIWQITLSALVSASTSSGANTEYIPASKNLGLGRISPASKLDINGQIMIRGGSPALGKILTSDLNGKASWVSYGTISINDATTLDNLDSLQFLRSDTTDNFSSGVLSTDAGTRFDVNGDLSIADADISLDGANTSFTQSTGNISLIPASGKDLSGTISSGGEFKINTSDFVFNGANSRIGIGTANPSTKLDVNGTIKGLTINGSSANFTNLTTSSLTNTGTTNFSKVIVTNNVNGATGNFTTGNFSNVIISGIVNGTTSSFDGDFTNGSVFFSNANGVISEDNSHLYWDQNNKRLAINHASPDMALDANGAMVIRHINDGNATGVSGTVTYESTDHVLTTSSNTAVTLNKPSGTTTGDLLIVFLTDQAPGEAYTAPSGWTLHNTYTNGTPGMKTVVYYKIATGSETSTYTFTAAASGSVERVGVIMRYSGVNTSAPINASAYLSTVSSSSPTPYVDTASATTTVTNTRIVKFNSILQSCSNWCITFPNGYSVLGSNFNGTSMDWRVFDKSQAAAGATDTETMIVSAPAAKFIGVTLAIAPSYTPGPAVMADPDNGATFLFHSNGGSATANPGDLFAKIKENSITKTIQIIDFNNGNLTNTSSSETLDGLDSTAFLRSDASDNYSSGTLTLDPSTTLSLDASSSLDINSTNLSIADTNITLDGANTSFTQSTGSIALVPASTYDLSTTITSGGEFKINTSDFIFNGTTTRFGIGTANPSTKLDVNGTIKSNLINGTTANFSGNTQVGKLISSGVVNGTVANFTTANFSSAANTAKLIASGVVNGTTANFSAINASSFNFTNANIGTLTSTTINNSGTASTAKLISSGLVNGTTANFNKVIASGSVNGSNANFNDIIISGILNGSTTSFDGDFTNGSILFSNAEGVISQNNSQLYWDRNNNRLAVGMNAPNEIITINGSLALKASAVPSAISDFGKLYVAANSRLYFQDDGGVSYSILNGMLASSSLGGSNTHFQFNDSGSFGGNGALAFIKASKTLQVPADAVLDINSTSVSIADPNISFDSASGTTFTPTAGQNLNIALATTGDFTVNTNQIYLDTSAAKLGLLINSPNEVLTVNGSISIKEGSAPSATSDFGKLYVKSSDSKLYFKDDSGSEYNISDIGLNVSIDNLTDAIANSTSIYLGNGSGLTSVGSSNTAIGIDSLHSNTTGANNTAVGYKAMYANTNGSNNSAFGDRALYSNISGQSNTAFGYMTLKDNTIGNYNTAAGSSSLTSNISGSRNNALGYISLSSNTNGDSNVALGAETLQANISGNGNTAIGYRALSGNRSGNYNTAIGHNSHRAVLNESFNTSLGYFALGTLRHGNGNIALGTDAISSMNNGSYNIAVGVGAGRRGTISPTSNGIHLGYRAGFLDSGNNNIFIGHNTGNGSISGSNNILIGYDNRMPPSASASNQLDIADTIYGDLANHNIGIGTTSIDTKLEINGTSMINTLVNKAFYTNSSGTNVTIDWNNGNKQQITLGHNVTFSFTAPSFGVGSFTLMLIQDGTGSRTVTWPASVKWPGGSAPTLSSSGGSIDMVTCLYTGSNYLCQIGLSFG